MNLSILYRGPLSSCNYTCNYCPFAKTKNTRKELNKDFDKLTRFIKWVKENNTINFSILFTPWGEALVRGYYQKAIVELSHLENVNKVSIQTNLSCHVSWLSKANLNKVALWTNFHSSQIHVDRFLQQCYKLDMLGVRYSVGVVAFKEEIAGMEYLREKLKSSIYLWANALKKKSDYYSIQEIESISKVDPLFHFNLKTHQSLNEKCSTGEFVFSVDGEGIMYRCHFIKLKIGNIYETNWQTHLMARTCTNESCGCYIGYAHLEKLKLVDYFGSGLLERILL